MASLDPNFHQETASIHREHAELKEQLDQLDIALEKIMCYSEVLTNLSMANQVMSRGKWIAEWLPKHYDHEETTVLQTISKMSPELASFARAMKRQHNQLRVRLEHFHEHISHLEQTRHVADAVAELKQEGKDLTRMLRLHMAVEEKKLDSIEN